MLDFQSPLMYTTIRQEKKRIYGPLVKWLRRRPLTAETGVRLPYGLFFYAPESLYLYGSRVFFVRNLKTQLRGQPTRY